ncbi:MAG: right-handed parallel beta-helix repeat-containing protein [Acetobacteraceae bacterium]|nr:right-handed parallel beta-helix repeat-containing protein [Acetobacteraceae bacterium]
MLPSRTRRVVLHSLVLALPAISARPIPALPAATLTTGPGQRFPSLAAAVAAARDGDTLLLQPGTYLDDFATIGRRLTLRSVGGLAEFVATTPPPNGKAILVIDTDVTIEGLSFAGSTSRSQNGAGIRYQGGHLRLQRCRFRGNQMNLLAAGDPAGSITIERCEFGPTVTSTSLSHGLYVNVVGTLTVRDSLFHGAATGHQIKSRALRSSITGCRIFDRDSHASYSVDLPNGGLAVLEGNLIEQGPNSRNPAIIHFGGEDEPHPDSALRITRNTVVNNLDSPAARLLRNQTGAVARIAENRVFGLDDRQVADGPAEVSGTQRPATPPVPDMAPPWAPAWHPSGARRR